MIKILPEGLTVKILQKSFDSKFSEVAMMMHVKAAKDEMIELGNELILLRDQSKVNTPVLDNLIMSLKYSTGDYHESRRIRKIWCNTSNAKRGS